MKTSLKSLAFLFAPVVLASACGGDIFGGSDMGTPACVTQPFRLQTTENKPPPYYKVVEPPMVTVTDSCMPPLTRNDFLGKEYKVENDINTGTITVISSTSSIVLGQGPVTCDKGVLSYSAFLKTGGCNYKISDQSNFTMVADNTFQLTLTETVSDITQISGMPACTMKPCTTQIFFQANKAIQ